MKKRVIGLIIVLLISCQVVLTAPIPSSPICEVNAIILEINTIDDIDIEIISVGLMIDQGYQPLYENFSCNEYDNKIIEEVSFWTDGDFEEGQTIKGEIHYFADEFSQGEVLDKVTIISEPEKNENNYLYYLVLLISFIILIFIILKLRKNSAWA